jgi:phosphoglycolate phosphatase-like HAD superfamily hydrolase
MIEAVIIDVDDTLCLTEAACFDLENEALQRMGRSSLERAVHLNTWGQPLFDAIATRSPGIDVEEFKVAYHPVIDEFIADGRLDSIPEANYEALDRLVALGKKLMLLTSRTHGEFKHLLAPDHLLSSRVSAFYYKDNMAYHKPDPRAFDEVLRDNSLQPGQCVYVGDSPSDAAASNQAGLSFMASLESGIRQREDFDGYRVAAFVNRFPDIVDAVIALDYN